MRWLPLRAIRDLAAVSGVTLALLLLLELALRAFWPQREAVTYVGHRRALVKDEVIGWVNNPGADLEVQTPEYRVEYRVNAAGLRDRSLHSRPPHPGSLRILLLGDSFTYGHGNNYGDIWPVLLERRLRDSGYDADVVKAGVPGYDTRMELTYLERLAPKYRPALVILAFLPNDLFTNTDFAAPVPDIKLITGAKLPGVVDGPEAALRAAAGKLDVVVLADRLLRSVDAIYLRLYLATPRAQYYMSPPNARLSAQLSLTEKLLGAGLAYCRSRGVAFAVLSIPQQFQVLAEAHGPIKGIDPGLSDRTLSRFAAAKGFAWMPALPMMAAAYRADGENLFYRRDGHLNPRGNQLVAQYLAGQLIARGLLARAGPPSVPGSGLSPARNTSVGREERPAREP